MKNDILINKSMTFTFSPNTLAAVLDALAELPFKRSNGPIQEIMGQIQLQNMVDGHGNTGTETAPVQPDASETH